MKELQQVLRATEWGLAQLGWKALTQEKSLLWDVVGF
jgi:hypothetical protein